MPELKLSTVKPDYQDLYSQLQNELYNTTAWKDLIEAATGQLLTSYVAGVGAYAQFSIERGVQENWLETARGSASVLQSVRDFGVRIQRKIPSSLTASFTRTDTLYSYTIPAYSTFKVDGNFWFFNKSAIVFAAGQNTVSATLEEGQLVVHTFTVTSPTFQKFYVGSNFNSSDSTVRVFVDGNLWDTTKNGIWTLAAVNTCTDSTTILGELEIKFGDNTNGNAPNLGAVVNIHEYTVQGSTINRANTDPGYSVTYTGNTNITGVVTSNIAGADDEHNIQFYKEVGARLGRSLNRAVTASDYEVICRTYSGVIAAKARAERDINPGNQAWQSTVEILLVTTTTWTTDQNNAFLAWLQDYTMLGVKNIMGTVTAVPTNIMGQLLVDNKSGLYNADSIIAEANSALNTALSPASDCIGKDVYISDIIDILSAIDGVKHVVLTSPTITTSISDTQYFKINTISLTVTYV